MIGLSLEGAGFERRGRWLVRGIDLEIETGRLYCLLGPNGAGKSSVLRLLNGQWRPTEGRVLLGDTDIGEVPRRQLAKRLSYVPQSSRPGFGFTVREFVALGRFAHQSRLGRTESTGVVELALERTDTAALSERVVTALSGGELQRVLIARCLAAEASILLLDEPTSNLDLAHSLDLLEVCRELVAQGRTVVLALHDLNTALRFADEVVLLADGSLQGRGTPDEVLVPERVSRVFGVEARMLEGPHGAVLDFSRRRP